MELDESDSPIHGQSMVSRIRFAHPTNWGKSVSHSPNQRLVGQRRRGLAAERLNEAAPRSGVGLNELFGHSGLRPNVG